MIATAPNTASDDWSVLYSEYCKKIYNYIYRRTSNPVLSEDLTADTFAKAIDYTQRGMGARESFSGWLYRIAHNAIIDHYRARARQKEVSIDDVWHMADPDDNPVLAAELALDREMLQRAMMRLTDEQTQVLTLRYWDGYSFGEIAETMGKTEGSVKALQHRALEAMCALLGGNGRPGRDAGCRAAVISALHEHGPMTITEIARLTNNTEGAVNAALYVHKGLFARVGRRPGKKSMAAAWGLVGIHDREAA